MKKKIIDLTEEEADNICAKNLRTYKNCDRCPFLFQYEYCIKDFIELKEVEFE